MNVAFLFNADDPEYGGHYGDPIMGKILDTGVLSTVQRHMRVSIGDVLTFMYSHRLSQNGHFELCKRTYAPSGYDKVLWDRLEPTFGTATVFAWLFQNMTSPLQTVCTPFY